MRGSPPLQALILMVTLFLLGWLGHCFIQVKHPQATDRQITELAPNASHDQEEAEIELTFSSLPLSYTLKNYTSDNEVKVVLESDAVVENPSYHEVVIPSHSETSYLLDVTWAEAPLSGTRHFVKIHISPLNGQAQSFSLLTSSQEMQESFDYSTTTPHRHE